MAVKIMCAHGNNPNLNEKAIRFLARAIGPLPMEKLEDGSWYCPCGYKTGGSKESQASST